MRLLQQRLKQLRLLLDQHILSFMQQGLQLGDAPYRCGARYVRQRRCPCRTIWESTGERHRTLSSGRAEWTCPCSAMWPFSCVAPVEQARAGELPKKSR